MTCQCAILGFVRSHPTLNDLVYWRRPLESAGALILGLGYLISLATLSIISVIAYTCIALLCCTGGYRLYIEIIGKRKAINNAGDSGAVEANKSHPFEKWLSSDFELPKDKLSSSLADMIENANKNFNKLRRIFILESYGESILFAAAMYIIARIGALINLLTLLILGFVALFTLPKLYELYQPQIDKALDQAKTELMKVWGKIKAKLETLPVIGQKLKAN